MGTSQREAFGNGPLSSPNCSGWRALFFSTSTVTQEALAQGEDNRSVPWCSPAYAVPEGKRWMENEPKINTTCSPRMFLSVNECWSTPCHYHPQARNALWVTSSRFIHTPAKKKLRLVTQHWHVGREREQLSNADAHREDRHGEYRPGLGPAPAAAHLPAWHLEPRKKGDGEEGGWGPQANSRHDLACPCAQRRSGSHENLGPGSLGACLPPSASKDGSELGLLCPTPHPPPSLTFPCFADTASP